MFTTLYFVQNFQSIKNQDLQYYFHYIFREMRLITLSIKRAWTGCKRISGFIPLQIISVLMILLVFGIWSHYDLKRSLFNLQYQMQMGPLPTHPSVQFKQILETLYYTPFIGEWEASIKKSSSFKNSKGRIQLMGTKTDGKNNLVIRIFDGFFRNSYFYDIEIKSESMITQQKFIKNSILVQSQSPMIGFLTRSEMIQTQFSQTIYIGSFKLKIDNVDNKILIEFMFSAPNSFNFFAKKLQQQQNGMEKIIYALILSVIAILQMNAALTLKKKIIEQENNGISKPRIAFPFILIGTLWDISCGFLPLYYLTIKNLQNLVIFFVPFVLWSFLIFVAQLALLKQTIKYYFLKKINQGEQIIFKSKEEIEISSVENLEEEEKEDQIEVMSITLSKKNSQSQEKINSNSSIQKKQSIMSDRSQYEIKYQTVYGSELLCHILIIMSLILGLFIVYVTNLQPFMLILSSFTLLVPQIIWNYHYGMMDCRPNQLCSKPQELAIFLYSIPRVFILIYCRSYTDNLFNFEKDSILCLFCIIGIVLQICVRTIQILYGGRSIMLKFIQKPQFTYFLKKRSQETEQCSICMYSLHELSGLQENDKKIQKLLKYNQYVNYENQDTPIKNKGDITNITSEEFEAGISDLIALNKITVTPCKHKFHSKCLAKWTDNKRQCPNCRAHLLPVQAL